MARGKVFISGYETRKEIHKDYWYSYLEEEEKGILRIYKQDELIYQKEANIGDAFEVLDKVTGGFVTPMTPPRKKGEAIAWLLGFYKSERATSCEEYRELLKKKWEKLPVIGYVEYRVISTRFEYVKYTLLNEEGSKRYNLACWVDEDITKQEILSLVPDFRYPKFYVKKVLREKFGISEEEVEQAFSYHEK